MKGLSFFSGAMGLDLGLEQAGIETLLVSEIDKFCQETIRHNKPEIPILGDIRDYTARDIRNILGIGTSQTIDLVSGGPPCQAFSTAGRRKGFEDQRGNVFLKYIDLISELQPTYAIIENVRGLLSAPLIHRPHHLRGKNHPPLTPDEQPGGALNHIIQRLETAGYSISFNLYNAANFGTPQIRERVVMLCSRKGIMPYLEPTHAPTDAFKLPLWKTFKEGIKGLNASQAEYIPFPEKRLKYYRLLQSGQYWKHLPEELQKQALGNAYYSGGGKTGFLRRLAWDKPSPTLVTHPAMPATDLAHPEELRPLSVQEYKRIQQFPDDWTLCGKTIDKYRQIGNAVPIGLGEAIGRLLSKHHQQQPIQTIPHFPYSRYKNTDDQSWRIEHSETTSPSSQLELMLA